MKTKILVALIGISLISGCATTEDPAEAEVNAIVDAQYEKQTVIKECILEFMEVGQTHVLDATKACAHIYGLRPNTPQNARTTSFEEQ